MHGCDARSVLVVNAEVDSMGGVGNDTKTSPRRAAIEKVQEELRQEYDVLKERRRELEFLEKGGDPLEFKFGTAVSVSVQSTSLTDQQLDQFVTSEAKGSFAFTASPHGDSVESSGRPGGTQLCEPNSADNLMLFDGENEFIEGERTSRCPSRTNIAPPEQSTQMVGNQNVKEFGSSAALGAPRKAYRRRNRTRPSRDGARSNSNDALTRVGRDFSLPSHGGPTESKGLVSDAEKQWDRNITGQPNSPNGGVTSKTLPSNNQVMVELDSIKAAMPKTDLVKVNQLNDVPDVIFSSDIINNQKDQHSAGVAQESPIEVAPEGPKLLSEKEAGFEGLESQLCSDKAKVDDLASSRQINGFSSAKGDRKSISNDGQNSSAALATKALDSESSCTQTSLSLDEKNDTEICTDPKFFDSTGNVKDQSSVSQRTSVLESDNVKDVKETKTDGICGFVSEERNSLHKNHKENGFGPKPTQELVRNESSLQNEIKYEVVIEGKESIGPALSETEGKPSVPVSDNSNNQDDNVCSVDHQGSFDSSVQHSSKAAPSVGISTVAHEGQQSEINLEVVTRADEGSILEEARIIEAKRKRITELSAVTTPMESRSKSHWDFVLDEMAWLANDFMQERLWKITAAAQMSYRAAFTSRLRTQELNDSWRQKRVANTLAKAVMDFWHSVKGNKKGELQCPRKAFGLTTLDYAMRFLKCNNFDVPDSQAEGPATPERVSDIAIVNMSWEENLTEENLFYTIPSGATETYRKSIESHVLQFEKTGTIMQEEVETSACDAVAEPQDYAYEEDEGETTMNDMPVAFDGNRSSRFSQKKRKKHLRTYSGRSYDVGADLSFTQCMENKVWSQQSIPAKRHTNSLNVSFPTKRVRTCYRQRVLSPFNAGTSGLQVSTKTDASSETSSFQDDQSTWHGGSHVPNNLEVESLDNFERHLKFDSAEVSTKPKKKKKAKFPGSSYEQRWTADSNFQNEQGDYSRKRLESHQFESNGGSGLFGQHIPKKPKIMRPSLESSFDNISPISGSVPSPAASQMSNMPSSNKFTRMLTGRDLSRKAKSLKMPVVQPGSGSQWSPFEDQALVVLVHDMGPNWELITDAINSTLQFKCIYRKPKECKYRHKILMNKTNGDGADSAEDSGSSQPYPSTLPGIPKGSARQLFQRLQGPVEEDTLKSHFEKIILVEHKYPFHKTQGDNQDKKPIQQAHSSHSNALSQVVPNNLSGHILTPLELCEAAPSSSLDNPSLGYQGPHSSGSSQGALGPMPPSPLNAGANSATIQGSPNVIHGNNFPSSPSPLNAAVRDGKYAISRTGSIPADEHQRMHHCNQLLPGRNISIPSAPGSFPGPDRGGVRLLPSGSSMGIICGINRGGMSTPRHGFQGIASSSMLNSGSMTSSAMVAMPNPVSMHSGVGSSQGNSMLRPRENLHMMRPTQNQETQRQMMIAELQIQASQVNSQTLSTSYPNQTASPHVPPTYPSHHQQAQSPHMLSSHHSHVQGTNHTSNSQQQTYALHLAKERQLQQRLIQQKQKFGSSNSLMPPVQQHQLPVSSSPLQNSPQTTSQPVSFSPLASSTSSVPQHQLKRPMLPHGLARSAQSGGSGPANQLNKQRPHQIQQHQPLQQTSRSHPQQRQPNAKLLKGVGRGNTLMNQNMQIDPSVLNGVSSNSGILATEKGDQMTNSMQNQGLYPGSGTKSSAPLNSKMQQPQQKTYSGQTASSMNPLQQTSHSENMSKGHSVPTASGSTSPACHQSISTPVISSSNHQPVPHSKPLVQAQKNLVNQSHPTSKRMVQPSRMMNSEPSNKLQAGESQFNQHTASNCSPIGTMTVSATARECNNATNAAASVSSNVSQWKAADPLFDSMGSLPNTATGSEHSSQVGQAVSQRQSSGSLSPAGHDANMHWKQPSRLQPHSPVHQPQQQL